ncbi:AfsR/SARP family transcriptional regulator [Glycomyces sp. MUSA5-2]|uniref:AfsR/SARP family transcriptional regulator n=1 Tax=Glycomyces sp. MUSA5-2 TaxID=2053002 RepID=UPI0030091644
MDATGSGLPPLRRRLLAVLLSQCGRDVTVDELAAALWTGAPPPSANATLQVHVHHLRKVLGGTGQIARGPAGYRIDVTADEFDALRFSELYERARLDRHAGSLEASIERVEAALALWRGEPYADIEPSRLIAAEAYRLTDQRLVARQALHEMNLDLGRHHGAIAPLTELARIHPHIERFAVLLMLAHYRAGRQAEALAVYRTHRERLIAELGVEPGQLLQRVHRSVLGADDRLMRVATSTLEGTWAPWAASADPPVEGLPVEAKRLLSRLRTVPDADFSLQDAAALVEGSTDVTAFVLNRLVDARLVAHRGHGRYRLQDKATQWE